MITFRRTIAALTAAIVLVVGTAPALAGEFNVSGNGSYTPVSPTTKAQAAYLSSDHLVTPAVVHVTTSSGFSWGDAAIGAAGAIAITAVIVGAGLILTQHRSSGGIRHA